jgi:hypothetical protein
VKVKVCTVHTYKGGLILYSACAPNPTGYTMGEKTSKNLKMSNPGIEIPIFPKSRDPRILIPMFRFYEFVGK